MIRVRRMGDGPIVRPFAERRMGGNVNGPSRIRTPEWLAGRLGRYHLYFAHHLGSHIRLAYADALEGPLEIYAPGVLDVAQGLPFSEHVASPDVHVDPARQELRMYVHASHPPRRARIQRSRPVWRCPLTGCISRCGHGSWAPRISGFGPGRDGIPPCPWGGVNLSPDWGKWRLADAREILRPQTEWEGAGYALAPSVAGAALTPVNQLRDPAFFCDAGRDYLICSVAGEAGLAIAEIDGLT